MLNLVKGHRVSLVENLFESFTKLTEHHLMANVHAEKILEVFQHFIAIHDETLFFILELPVSIDREKVIASNIIKEFHKDVYYIDACSRKECLALLIRYGDLLINDGIKQKLVYDIHNNTIEFNDDGVEHYDGLLFYKVDEFEDSLKKIDKGELEDKKLYLTRDNLPKKIFGIDRKHRNYEFEEIVFD